MSNAQNISNSGLEEIKVGVYEKSRDICAQTRDSVKAVYNNITSGDYDAASAGAVSQIYQRVISEHDILSKLVSILNTAIEYYDSAESQLASKMQLNSLTIDKCATIGSLVAATALTAWQICKLSGDPNYETKTEQLTGAGGKFTQNNSNVISLDEFNGVKANYKQDDLGNMYYDTENNQYQCSEYVNRYYTEKQDAAGNVVAMQDSKGNRVTGVHDLLYKGYVYKDGGISDGVPQYFYKNSNGVETSAPMVLTSSPKEGDVLSLDNGEHWAIVKQVIGDNAVVIEQNYQYKVDNVWYAKVNKKYSISAKSTSFFTLP